MVHLMEPRLASRNLAILSTLLDPEFGTEAQTLDRFLAWERQVRYEQQTVGIALGDDMKIAVVTRKLPEQVRHSMQLRAAEIGSDYEKFRLELVSFLQARRSWSTSSTASGLAPMEIDLL